MFHTFAPYAFFCLRASFLWALSSSTPGQNDRKDLEYLYYLPFTELFSSKDGKHETVVRLLGESQKFVPGIKLKEALSTLTVERDFLSRHEKIKNVTERDTA